MDPRPPDDEPGRPGGAEEALRRLEERLAKASEAAERLVAEAAGTAARAASGLGGVGTAGDAGAARAAPPPSGWQQPGAGDAPRPGSDVELLSQLIASLRELIPPELQQRLADALRELLMALRALIDWYLERAERRRAAPAEVQDIPIL